MNLSDLSGKQIEALSKIESAGDAGLPAVSGRRVTVNGNCLRVLDHLGLIVDMRAPYRLTETGKAALAGHDVQAMRHVFYARTERLGFIVSPTFDRAQGKSEWLKALSDRRAEIGDDCVGYGGTREDRFRATFPGVEVRGED